MRGRPKLYSSRRPCSSHREPSVMGPLTKREFGKSEGKQVLYCVKVETKYVFRRACRRGVGWMKLYSAVESLRL